MFTICKSTILSQAAARLPYKSIQSIKSNMATLTKTLPKLVLHFDVNETILLVDDAGGDTFENCLNKTICKNKIFYFYFSRTDTDLTKCIDCPVGKTLGVPSGSKCIDCIPGRFSGVLGSKSIDCGKCPIGYSTEEGAGTDTIPTKDKCVACLLGTYADTEGLTKCLACAAGKFSDVHVKDGEDFCKDCVVGQHRPSKDEDGVDTDLTKCK